MNIEKLKVTSYELEPVNEIFGWCKHCSNPILSDAPESCSYCDKSLFL